MKKFFILWIIAGVFVSATAQTSNSHNVMWYEQPATKWNEALPVGNGRLGAMVYGNFEAERIQLNEESVWGGSKVESNADARASFKTIQQLLIDGKIDEAAKLAEATLRSNPLRIRSYQPLGDLTIEYGEKGLFNRRNATSYRRELDLETGIARSEALFNGVRYTQEVFASAPDNAIIVRISTDQPGSLTAKVSLSRQQDATVRVTAPNELTMEGQVVDLPMKDASPAGIHMKFAAQAIANVQGGKLTAINNSFFIEQADQAVFYITGATDYNFEKLDYDRTINPAARCASILSGVKKKSFADLLQSHTTDHAALFNRVSLNLFDDTSATLPTDKRLEAVKKGATDKGLAILLFQYGRYMLMGSSRSPGLLPANLQGVWNEDINAAWNSDFHTNINIQMNYWPAEVCNLSETVVPFSNLINALRVPGRETARKTYHSTGWTMNHLTDVFGRTAISDGVGWGTYPMAAAWLVLHQWEYYLFTQDRDYLRHEAYPTMKEAADFVLGLLIKDKNGMWVTAPSNSPENRYRLPNGETYMLTYGATKDIQLIRALFSACISAGRLMGEEKAYMKQLQAVIDKLPPTKISPRYGIIQEWIEDYEEVEPGHRHMSQLFGLFPGTELNASNPQLFEAARRTVERRQEYAAKGQGSSPGWNKAWLINFYARLGNGDAAWEKTLDLLRTRILSNLFNDHPPFQIDGNFGYTAGVAELLLQSHENDIHLLPALPSAWQQGEVKGLKARGNVVVDMAWESGRLATASLTSAADCTVAVRYAGKTQKIKLKAEEARVIKF